MRRKIQPLLCELHAHTTWSDGELSVPQLVDLYGRSGFDVLCITDHCLRSDDPWLDPTPPHGVVHAGNYNDYLSKIEAEAQRARSEYDLLVVPGLELTYNDLDPYLAAHAVAVGCRAYVSVDGGVGAALAHARGEGAALVAAHPFRRSRSRGQTPSSREQLLTRKGSVPVAISSSSPGRSTLRLAREWRAFAPLVDRWELFNRHDLFGWVAESGLPAVASGDFHRPEHLHGWKTLLPCAKDEAAVVGYLRSSRPAFLTRIDEPVALLDAA
jgi:hypothetical protein